MLTFRSKRSRCVGFGVVFRAPRHSPTILARAPRCSRLPVLPREFLHTERTLVIALLLPCRSGYALDRPPLVRAVTLLIGHKQSELAIRIAKPIVCSHVRSSHVGNCWMIARCFGVHRDRGATLNRDEVKIFNWAKETIRLRFVMRSVYLGPYKRAKLVKPSKGGRDGYTAAGCRHSG